jgi:lipopolysaccharide heptosyltransferase II
LLRPAAEPVSSQILDATCFEPRRILLIRLDLMGDVLFTLPLAVGLREHFPEAQIVMLTLPYTAPLARLSPSIDEVIEVDTNRIRRLGGVLHPATWSQYLRAVRELRKRRFDLAISVYGQMGSLWASLSGAVRTVGYAGEAYPYLLSDPVPGGRHRERMHEVEYVRRLGAHVGVDVPPRLSVTLPPDAGERAQALLARHGIDEHAQVVLVHAGAANGRAKRWPEDNWSAFADALCLRSGARVVLVGSRVDAALADRVVGNSSAPVTSLAGRTDILELAMLVARADLVASGDSGPLHLAVALARPLLAVYGPTDPSIYGPYNPRAPVRLLRADLPCSPCYTLAATAECPLGDPICMRLVSVEAMLERAVELLAGSEHQLPVPEQHALQDAK